MENEWHSRLAGIYQKSNQDWGASIEPLKNDFILSDRITTLWLLLDASYGAFSVIQARQLLRAVPPP